MKYETSPTVAKPGYVLIAVVGNAEILLREVYSC
jgi:hypothetical protein